LIGQKQGKIVFRGIQYTYPPAGISEP
jgi:hypothetical protein